MNLQEAINHPKVNVFDIVKDSKGRFDVYTYKKPGETKEDFEQRDYNNICKAMQLIKSCK